MFFIDILIASLLGLIFGIICGLLPGIHINLVSIILFSLSSFLLGITSPIILMVFIVSMSISQCFLDFIPSIFLGAPDENTALSILPGHRFLLEGKGYGAIKLTAIGGLFGLLLALAISPFLIFVVPIIYPYVTKIMPLILTIISLFLIMSEEKIFPASFIFLISGILGFIVLNFGIVNEPLLPLFTSLFGIPLLVISIFEKVKIPEQKIISIKISKKETIKTLIKSLFSSPLVSFLPGVGSSQAAVIANVFGKISEKAFLILLGAINIIVMVLGFVALFSINKPRTGSAVIIGKLIPEFGFTQLLICLAVALFIGGFSFLICLFFARNFAKIISKINYQKLCLTIIFFVTVLCIIVSGWFSLIILITGTSIGILCSKLGVKKINLMGCLLIPVILYYFI